MRPTIDETWLAVAAVLARRGTCLKMQVGCVLTDYRGRFLAGNYNGVASGQPHCNEGEMVGADFEQWGGNPEVRRPTKMVLVHPHACAGASAPPGSDLCEAVHAEQNALTRCLQPDEIWNCYVTVSPCMRCVKQLLNTDCQRIIFLEEYGREPQARRLWESAGRAWVEAPPEVRAAVQRCPDEFLIDTLGGKLTTFDQVVGYISKLEMELSALRSASTETRQVLEELLRHCDASPEGETDFERAVVRARQVLAADSRRTP